MKLDEKRCPRCAETVKKAALVCKHCGYTFPVPPPRKQAGNSETALGCIFLVIIVAVVLSMCSHKSPEQQKAEAAAAAAQQKQEAAQKAEDHRKGFDCLSAWDGSNESMVDQVKATLRDPDSFEHVETKVTPADMKGDHLIMMQYRAKNGFGGMNVDEAIGTQHENCSVTLTGAAVNEGG